MRIADKILTYLLQEQAEGRLHPGDKIPTYMELCRMFHTSYATVFNAIANFEKEQLVERHHGKGVYLKGSSPLKIIIREDSFLFPEDIRDLLNRECGKQDLNLDFEFSSHGEWNPECAENADAILAPYENEEFPMAKLDYSAFPDYEEQISGFLPYVTHSNTMLPFCLFSHQMFVNPLIEKQTGIHPSGSDFSWLNDIIRQAAKGKSCYRDYWLFSQTGEICRYLYLLVQLLIASGRSVRDIPSGPVFHTPAGHLLIDLLRAMERNDRIVSNFSDSLCNFYTGSWFIVQWKKKFALKESQIKIVPYEANGRPIYFMKQPSICTYIRNDLSFYEKKRIWSFLKILISKKFQQALCDSRGTLSIRKDIGAYTWAAHPEFKKFVPCKDSIVINGNILQEFGIFTISALIEQAAFFHADPDSILSLCDQKIRGASGFSMTVCKI